MLDDKILLIACIQNVSICPVTAAQMVAPCLPNQRVITAVTEQNVITFTSDQIIMAILALR